MASPDPSTYFTEDDLIQLEFLRDEEIDELISENLLSSNHRTDDTLRTSLTFPHPELTLYITTGPYYPVFPLTWRIENYTLPRTVIHYLRTALHEIAAQVDKINTLAAWQSREDSEFGIFERSMAVLQLARETKSHLTTHREVMSQPSTPAPKGKYDPYCILPTIEPLDIATAGSGGAYHLLGATVPEICALIPSGYRVTHVENVLRQNLQHAFLTHQDMIRSALGELSINQLKTFVARDRKRNDRGRTNKEGWIEEIVRPRMTFHGTNRNRVANIVRRGFLKPGSRDPGSGEKMEVRCGSTYGRGIYSSPSASFALSYTDWDCDPPKDRRELFGIKLFVCAVLMGRSAQVYSSDNWRSQNEPYPGADSHVANLNNEYVVFSESQILPCYVIHLDWGADNKYHVRGGYGGEDTNWVTKKEILTARAAKHFPFGFGSASGTRFVIEAVADVDEDDEEYGDYQADRVEGYGEGGEGFWQWAGINSRDQYYQERRATK